MWLENFADERVYLPMHNCGPYQIDLPIVVETICAELLSDINSIKVLISDNWVGPQILVCLEFLSKHEGIKSIVIYRHVTKCNKDLEDLLLNPLINKMAKIFAKVSV